MDNIAIEVKNVSMRFNLAKEKVDNLKEYFVRFIKKQLVVDEFYALRDVSFTVDKGDSFAIVGANGSGKSTMLKIISGILKPTCGSVVARGSIAPLIELGAGFDMELTARENIYLNGAVLGYDRRFMYEQYNQIMDFSELREFEDVPLKNYSSGMVARLGFSIATLVKPNILIVDEILAVGDYAFQKKCEKKMAELMSGGTTLILVSHSIDQVREVCKKAAWIKSGKLVEVGDVDYVCNEYLKDLNME